MKEKFLYYWGAGASAQTLPTVHPIIADGKLINPGFNQRLKDVAQYLNHQLSTQNIKKITYFENIVEDLTQLAKASEEFATIDTYAKYLYIKDKKKLSELKATLIAYFVIDQFLCNQTVDRRYLSWITSILSDLNFPSNIKIISWNYDYQLQLAATKFRQEHYSYHGLTLSSLPPLIPYFPSNGRSENVRPNAQEFSLLHINGLAGTFFNTTTDLYDNFFLHPEELDLQSDFEYLKRFNDGHSLNFSWENSLYQNYLIEVAEELSKDTTIMIVIGYSFPFFNRYLDKKVFENIKRAGKLKKIYFQDPILDGSFLRAQFELDDSIEIIHIPKVDSFYIPFEL